MADRASKPSLFLQIEKTLRGSKVTESTVPSHLTKSQIFGEVKRQKDRIHDVGKDLICSIKDFSARDICVKCLYRFEEEEYPLVLDKTEDIQASCKEKCFLPPSIVDFDSTEDASEGKSRHETPAVKAYTCILNKYWEEKTLHGTKATRTNAFNATNRFKMNLLKDIPRVTYSNSKDKLQAILKKLNERCLDLENQLRSLERRLAFLIFMEIQLVSDLECGDLSRLSPRDSLVTRPGSESFTRSSPFSSMCNSMMTQAHVEYEYIYEARHFQVRGKSLLSRKVPEIVATQEVDAEDENEGESQVGIAEVIAVAEADITAMSTQNQPMSDPVAEKRASSSTSFLKSWRISRPPDSTRERKSSVAHESGEDNEADGNITNAAKRTTSEQVKESRKSLTVFRNALQRVSILKNRDAEQKSKTVDERSSD